MPERRDLNYPSAIDPVRIPPTERPRKAGIRIPVPLSKLVDPEGVNREHHSIVSQCPR